MKKAPCFGDHGGAPAFGVTSSTRHRLVAAGLRLAIRVREHSGAFFSASRKVAQHVIRRSVIGDFVPSFVEETT